MSWARGSRSAAWLLAATLSTSLTTRSLAQPSAAGERPDAVTLVQDACASYDTRDFARLLEIELHAVGVAELIIATDMALVRAKSAGLALVHLSCESNGAGVIAEVADFVSGNQIRRELPVADIEVRARARALALAVASLVESSWIALAARGPGAPNASQLPFEVRNALRQRLHEAFADTERPPGFVSSRRESAPSVEPKHAALALFASNHSFPGRSTALLGAELAYLPVLGPFRLALSVDALGGSHELLDADGELADVLLYWVSGGLALLWSSDTRPELSLGPYARIGYAFAAASSLRPGYTATNKGSPVAALGLATLLRAELGANVDVFAGFDLGYTPSGVVFLAGDNRVAGMAEVTTTLRVGLGLDL